MRLFLAAFWLALSLPSAWGLVSGSAVLSRHVQAAVSPARHVQAAQDDAMRHVQLAMEDVAMRLRSARIALAARTKGLLADDLMLALVSPEAFSFLCGWRMATFGEMEGLRHVLDGARRQIRAMGSAPGSPLRGAATTVRSKGLWSTFHKATVRDKAVHDVLAVRVVLRGEDADVDVYGALAALRAQWPAVPGRFKDYVAFPKVNGYQSLHDTLTLPCGRPFEVQIRTQRMHRDATFGEAAHSKYKGDAAEFGERLLASVAAQRRAVRWPLQPAFLGA